MAHKDWSPDWSPQPLRVIVAYRLAVEFKRAQRDGTVAQLRALVARLPALNRAALDLLFEVRHSRL